MPTYYTPGERATSIDWFEGNLSKKLGQRGKKLDADIKIVSSTAPQRQRKTRPTVTSRRPPTTRDAVQRKSTTTRSRHVIRKPHAPALNVSPPKQHSHDDPFSFVDEHVPSDSSDDDRVQREHETRLFRDWMDGPLSPTFKQRRERLQKTDDQTSFEDDVFAVPSVDQVEATSKPGAPPRQGAPALGAVNAQVHKARAAFEQTFQDVMGGVEDKFTTQESEYDAQYHAFDLTSRSCRPNPIHSNDSKLFQDALSASAPVGKGGAGKAPVTVHSYPSWFAPRETEEHFYDHAKTEEMSAYSPKQVKAPTLAKRPEDNLNNSCVASFDRHELIDEEVKKLRDAFTEEIQHLHSTAYKPDYRSEYQRAFDLDGPQQSQQDATDVVGILGGKIDNPAILKEISTYIAQEPSQTRDDDTEYNATYKAVDMATRDVDKTHFHKSILTSGLLDNPILVPEDPVVASNESDNNLSTWFETEYMDAFETPEENAREAAAAAASRTGKLQSGNFVTEYQSQFNARNEKVVVVNPHTLQSTVVEPASEYQSAFDPRFRSPNDESEAPEDKEIPPVEPNYVTVYQDSFDLHHTGEQPKEDVELVDHIEPVVPGYVSEYQRAYDFHIPLAVGQSRVRQVLKPYYSVPPRDDTKHKHRLFASEAVRGFVPRTEYMSQFRSPKGNVELSNMNDTRKQVMVPSEKVDLVKAVVEPTKDVVEPPKDVVEPVITAKDASRLAKAAPQASERQEPKQEPPAGAAANRWWVREGKQLWSHANPVTRNLRYNPLGNYFKTPKTEYMSQFCA